MKKTKNSISAEPMDERQKQISQKAVVFGFFFIFKNIVFHIFVFSFFIFGFVLFFAYLTDKVIHEI